MITYSSNELIPASVFAKKFGSYISMIKDNSVNKLAILKNNKVEAVVISKDEYEKMQSIVKSIEAQQLVSSIKSGLKDVKEGKTKPIEMLWDELED